MFHFHFYELSIRCLYVLLSFSSFFFLFAYYLPTLLSYSPLFFLHTHWEDAIFTYISLSTLAACLFTFPLFLFHFYLFLKPALVPEELSKLHLSLLFYTISFVVFWACLPSLLTFIPIVLLAFHGDFFYFTPSLDVLTSLAWDIYICSFLLLLFPFLLHFGIKRPILLLFAFLISSFVGDILSFILLFTSLTLFIELSFLFHIWSQLYLSYLYPAMPEIPTGPAKGG